MFYLLIEDDGKEPFEIISPEVDVDISTFSAPEEEKLQEIPMDKHPAPESFKTAEKEEEETLLPETKKAFIWFLRHKNTNSREGLREILPTFRSKTILLLCFPSEFKLHDFAKILQSYNEEVLGFRILERKNAPAVVSMVFYFKNQIVAESFYIVSHFQTFYGFHIFARQEMNAKKINEKSECLHLVFIDQIFFINNCMGGPKGHEAKELQSMVTLPDCPVCLEKLNGSLTGLTSPVVNFLISIEDPGRERWGTQRRRCPSCQVQLSYLMGPRDKEEITEAKGIKCNGESCSEAEDLWVCLICGDIGCSRYKAAHAVLHHSITGHSYTLELKSSRIWDYERDGYVHRLLRGSGTETSEVLILPEETGEQDLAHGTSQSNNLNEKYLAERAEALVVQYNCLLSQQIEELRKNHEEQLQKARLEYESSEQFLSMRKKEADLEAEISRIVTEIEAIEKEKKDLLKKNKIMLEKRQQTLARTEELRGLTSLLLSGESGEEQKESAENDEELEALKIEINKQKLKNESLMRKLC